MDINRLLHILNMSQYRLSKDSGIPLTTISDICSNKTSLEKCSALTLFKIGKAVNVSVEDLLTKQIDNSSDDFDVFKSSICHMYKSMNLDKFISTIISSNDVEQYFSNKEYSKCFYLIAIIDYACDKNKIKRIHNFDHYRQYSLFVTKYPKSIEILDALNQSNVKASAFKNSLPQFKKFNIVESEIENVY